MHPTPVPVPYRLPIQKKLQLALSLSIIYFPILFYINFSEWNKGWAEWRPALPFLLIGMGVALPLYFVWLNIAEWLQFQLFRWFDNDFLLELRLPAQLLTLGISLALAAGFIAAFFNVLIFLYQALHMLPNEPPTPRISAEHQALYHRANTSFFIMLMLSTFYLLANSQAFLHMRASRSRAEQLETEKLQAQLAALKQQVNPHFLFNSLSILSSLVHVDAELSEQFIEQLARAYRYTLEQQDHDLVPLATEVDFIQAYTFLLKIRFEDKLDVQLDLPEAARVRYQVAPLTLQLLVENAVKHNQMSAEQPLRVSIGLEGNELVVRNTLQRRPAAPATSTGVGLQNIVNRYRLLTPRPVQVTETPTEFIIRIPLLPA
jgi:two-component system LytT family sensor kinase